MTRPSPLLLDGRALLDADRLRRAGLADRRASFELSFARLPRHTGFLVVAGVESLLDLLSRPLLEPADLEAARRLGDWDAALLDRLATMTLRVDIDSVSDGAIVFARTPVITVEGTFFETTLVGALVRATIQRETAIASRTARLTLASGGDAVVDASSALIPYPDTSLSAARAAHVGGSSSTTNALAACALQIPFRSTARIELGALSPTPPSADSWGDLPEELTELGAGDDEEALLVEAKRLGATSAGWLARGLADADARALPLRYELVALEQDGAWAPRRGISGREPVVPGRKMVARYTDVEGRAVADVVHLNNERVQTPRSVGAHTLTPLARPVMRGGQTLEARELPGAGRERFVAGRASLPEATTHLRAPAIYPVRLSSGLVSLRDAQP